MDIDEQLINQNTESSEADKAGEFRASRRAGISKNEPDAAGKSFREQVKISKGLNITTEDRAKELVFRDSPIRKMTDSWLKFAWENLIDSWGLTLFYIDLHVFLNKVFGPRVFRTLGEEWIPESIKKLGDGKTKAAASLLRIVEGSGVGCLNLGCLFLIILVLSIIAMIYSVIEDPIGSLYQILKNSSVSDFLSLIKGWW